MARRFNYTDESEISVSPEVNKKAKIYMDSRRMAAWLRGNWTSKLRILSGELCGGLRAGE